jgi:hypothetical protein
MLRTGRRNATIGGFRSWERKLKAKEREREISKRKIKRREEKGMENFVLFIYLRYYYSIFIYL